jgi:hypothetical protein
MTELEGKIGKIVRAVSDASMGNFVLEDFLEQVVDIGCNTLDANYCSVFLLTDDEGTLQLIANNTKFGDKIREENVEYYVPKRKILKKKFRGKIDQKLKEKNLIEKGQLSMGITAMVVKSGKCFRGTKKRIKIDSEYRGKYEKEKGLDYCNAVLLIPLDLSSRKFEGYKKKAHSKAAGVIKVENPVKDKQGFSENDETLLFILAKCITSAIDKMEKQENSYKNLFGGAKLLSKYLLLKQSSEMRSNTLVVGIENVIIDFARHVHKYDIYGIQNMYDKIISVAEKINNQLGFKHECINIIKVITKKFEEVLGADPTSAYREHLIHQFQVFLLGLYIIKANEDFQKTLMNFLKDNVGIEGSFDNVIRVWFLSSMFHDFAYSLERINDWLGDYFKNVFSRDLEGMKLPFTMSWENLFTVGNYEYCRSRLFNRINERLILKLSKDERFEQEAEIEKVLMEILLAKTDGRKKNHGLFGGLILCNHLLDKEKLCKNEAIFDIVLESGAAMAIHTSDVYIALKRVQTAELDDMPFAFLLVYCDNSQEWGRPWMSQHKIAKGAIELDKLNVTMNAVEITLVCHDGKKLEKETIDAISEVVAKFDSNWANKYGNTTFTLKYQHMINGRLKNIASLT